MLLARLARFGRRHYRPVFAIVAAAVLASVALASRLRFDADVLSLLPQEEPAVETLQGVLKEFGSLDFLAVVVRIPEGAVLDPYLSYADRLGQRLSALPEAGPVEYRLGELDELVGAFLPQSILFLDAAGREAMLAKLEEPALAARAGELRRLVGTPQSVALKSLLKLDPLGVSEVFLDRFAGSRAGLEVDWLSGYLLSRDHRMLLLLAQPPRPPQDVDFSRAMIRRVEAEIAAAQGEWPALAGGAGGPPPAVELAGRYVIALADDATIRGDVAVNVVTSLGGVLALFLLAFRRVGLLLYALVPLCAGLALTFGFSALAFERLSVATSGVAALLIGLGIDFVIVSYGRFVEERRAGATLGAALAAMSGSSGRAVVLGALTTAATFYAFAITEFAGLRQMGYLAGTGILFCMGAVLLLLPAMLSWSEEHHRRRERVPRLILHGFGSGRLLHWALRHPRRVLGVGLVVTAAAGVLAPGVRFDDSVASMRPPDAAGVALRDEVSQRFGAGIESMMLVVRGETPEDVLARVDVAAAGAAELVREGVLTGVDAVTSVLPSPARQAQAIDWIEHQRAAGRIDLARVRERFGVALAAAGLRAEPFAAGLDLLDRALGPRAPLRVEDLERSPAIRRLLDRYLHRAPDGSWRSVVYLYPPPQAFRREPPPGAVALASRLGPDVVLTGSNVVSQVLRRVVIEDAWVAGILGFVLVAALLWFDYRSLVDSALSLAPLAVGIVWMLGGMALAGIPMNFMNIFVSTMIIGIGVDYGIHMMHRYRELGAADPVRLQAGLAETGKAVVMAALSTVVGFGSLWTSHYPGLRSMGQVAVLGALATCLVAITMLPAFLVLIGRHRR